MTDGMIQSALHSALQSALHGMIHGMDISSMDEVVKCGGKFYDGGQEKGLLEILKSYGVNYVRLRLWLEPCSGDGKPYGAGGNDLEVTVKLAKQVKEAGLRYLLDFQYSDFWADPGKQIKPKAWKDYGEKELETAVYAYTRDTLLTLKGNGCLPDMVQVGNEITNGLLWPEGKKPAYDHIVCFVNAGIRGVREVEKSIPVMLHLDHGNDQEMYKDWFDNYLRRGGEDFEVIGMSYYPVWNGNMQGLIDNMNMLAARYGKPMVVVEVSQPFTLEDYAEYEGLAQEQRKGYAAKPSLARELEYPATVEGQCAFMERLIREVAAVKDGLGIGYFYWEPAWLPVKGSGWATPESLEYMNDSGPCGNEWANQALFDYEGNALPALGAVAGR